MYICIESTCVVRCFLSTSTPEIDPIQIYISTSYMYSDIYALRYVCTYLYKKHACAQIPGKNTCSNAYEVYMNTCASQRIDNIPPPKSIKSRNSNFSVPIPLHPLSLLFLYREIPKFRISDTLEDMFPHNLLNPSTLHTLCFHLHFTLHPTHCASVFS